MAFLLFVAAFIFIYLDISCILHHHHAESKKRYAFIYTLLTVSCLIFISTELLSSFKLINNSAIIVLWSVITGVSIFIWLRWGKHIPLVSFKLPSEGIQKFFVFAIAFICGITFLISICAFPNNWDSMTYHLARVMHWLQNENVNYYPTGIDRQVTQPPLAEYFILHFYALTGTDKLVNLVQWIFMTGSLVTVSAIVKEAGFSKRAALSAVLFAITIPMGILQSSSTQNDYVLSFFILTAVLFLLQCLKNNFFFRTCILFAFSVSLACITKGTAYIFIIPLLTVFIIYAVLKKRKRSPAILLVCLFIFLLFNALFFYRNLTVYDNPLGNNYDLQNTTLSVGGMLSNTSKNIAMHFNTPVPFINNTINEIVTGLHHLVGIDIHSEKYNNIYSPQFKTGMPSLNEDGAGSILHVLLCIIFIFFGFKKKYRHTWLPLLFILVITMMLLFSLILKWQIWHVRLHLPMLLLASVCIACIMTEFNNRIFFPLCLLFFLYALPFLFYNQSRPLIGKSNIFSASAQDQYFINNKVLQQPFEHIAGEIINRDIHNVGLTLSGDGWEYPFWFLLRHADQLRVEHVNVLNQTKRFSQEEPFASFIPEAIITNIPAQDTTAQIFYKDTGYIPVYKNGKWAFYCLAK